VCIWDLDSQKLYDLFRNDSPKNLDEIELASDGNILDMCYCQTSNKFAYASSDTICYIRQFSIHGSEMILLNTLVGHTSEVNCIRWNPLNNTWVSGGEDSTLRIWVCY
jgi:WD40 repeat protein